MNFDPRTVVILIVLSTLLMSISLFAVSRGYLAEMRGVTRWATGTLLQSIGWILLAFIGVIPSYIAEIGSPLIILGLALYYHALVAFKEISSKIYWIYAVVSLNLLLIFYFLLIVPNMAARIVVASATGALLMFASAKLLFSSRLKKLPISHGITGILFAVCSLVLVVRAIYYLVWNTAPDQSAFEHNIVQDIAFLIFFLAGVVSPFTFVLMCNDRYTAKALLRTQELANKNDELEEASRVKGQFLATMSHELRTPLNGLLGFMNQLGKTRLDDQQRDYLRTINLSSRMLLNVINDVLDYSKIEAGKLLIETYEFDLREFIDETISTFSVSAEEKGLDLICVIDHRVHNYLLGDSLRLSQVLTNLLGNAIKFTEQGEVLLEVRQIEESDSTVSLQISVSDTGIGISEESLERLFQPFVQADSSITRQYGGTGLGLVIVRRLIDLMGGSIEIESEVLRGTRFNINLMLKKQAAPENNNKAHDLSHINLYVITPNLNIARSISENLSYLGIVAKTSSCGLAAIPLIRDAYVKEKNIHGIIFDHAVTDVTSAEFSDYLHAKCNFDRIPIMLLGNISYCLHGDELKKEGCCCYFNKPLKNSELYQQLVKLFISSQTEMGESNATIPTNEEGLKLLYGKRVLIVDDNNINRKLVQILVAELGGDFDSVENGLQAVDAYSHKEYDAILMDVNMPVMDGLEATRRIRDLESASRRTLIFALTANALPEDKERFLKSGMDDYISKPISENSLLSAFAKWNTQDKAPSESICVKQENSPNDSVPALNPQLGIQLSFANPDTWHAVLELMLDELADYSKNLAEYSNDIEQVIFWSHRLAGASCYCGTPALYQAAKQVEINCEHGSKQLIQDSLSELHRQIDRLIELDAAGKLRRNTVIVY